jgi:hypothetical protein
MPILNLVGHLAPADAGIRAQNEEAMAMGQLNLVLRLRIDGETDLRVKAASRIGVDAKDGLTVTDAETGAVETIPLRRIEALSIHSLSSRSRRAMAS